MRIDRGLKKSFSYPGDLMMVEYNNAFWRKSVMAEELICESLIYKAKKKLLHSVKRVIKL